MTKSKLAKAKKFRVSIGWTSIKYFDVEALTAGEAEVKAAELCDDGVAPDDYWESSEEIKGSEEVKPDKAKATARR